MVCQSGESDQIIGVTIGGSRGLPGTHTPPLVARFFRFYMLIFCKVAVSDLGASLRGQRPPLGNPGSATGYHLPVYDFNAYFEYSNTPRSVWLLRPSVSAVLGLSQPNTAVSVRHKFLCNLLESQCYDAVKFGHKTGF